MTTEMPLRVVQTSDALAEAAVSPPAAAPAAPPERQPITVALAIPIEAHGERLTALTLRPLQVRDLLGHDLPFQSGKIDTEASAFYIQTLAGIPRSSVLQMDPGDFMAAVNAMAPFFLKLDRTS